MSVNIYKSFYFTYSCVKFNTKGTMGIGQLTRSKITVHISKSLLPIVNNDDKIRISKKR